MSTPRLPDAELEVLACLWQQNEATARQVREAIADYRPLAHASVVTLLGRLEAKGLVSRRKADVGKAFVYTPTLPASRTFRTVLGDVLQRIFRGDGVAMVASLFETKPPTQDELVELQALLDKLKKRSKASTKRKKS